MKSLIEYINESNKIELLSDGNEHGYDYVDLGLPSGTMWATCNVGATKPEYSGQWFQFGRVDGYMYPMQNKFTTDEQNKQDTGSQYTPLTTSGKVYKKNDILDLEDDAAHVNMGGKWMMPTNDQLEELINNTTYDTVKVNGIKGMMFTSNINGHQMFIPFMQGCWYNRFWEAWHMSICSLWSSSVWASNADCAYRLGCDSSGQAYINGIYRSYAFTVRGVFKK